MVMWGLLKSIVLIVLALFLASGIITNYPGDLNFEDDSAGFLSGIIHGVIAPIMLVAAIFTSFTMYELNNNGWWYNFGFLFGILITWGGGKGTSHVIKNYYHMPKREDVKEKEIVKKEPFKKEPPKTKLSEEDHKRIGSMIEEKVTSVIKVDTKSKKKQKKEKPAKKKTSKKKK